MEDDKIIKITEGLDQLDLILESIVEIQRAKEKDTRDKEEQREAREAKEAEQKARDKEEQRETREAREAEKKTREKKAEDKVVQENKVEDGKRVRIETKDKEEIPAACEDESEHAVPVASRLGNQRRSRQIVAGRWRGCHTQHPRGIE